MRVNRKTIFAFFVLAGFLLAGFGLIYFAGLRESELAEASQAEQYAFVSQALGSFLERSSEGLGQLAFSTAQFIEEQSYLRDYTYWRDLFSEKKIDFIEANLEELKARVYKKGGIEKEFAVLAKGQPQYWGGTAAGLYKIISGNKESYSVITEVYMPWALKFYGKYYLHGQPYYWRGQPLQTEHTGGCLRLSDEDAKELYQATEIDMPVLVIDKKNDNYRWERINQTPFPQVSAESFLAVDLKSGFVAAAKNPLAKRPIASLTKLMTALVAVENVDLKKSIRATEEMLDRGYSQTQGLEAGNYYQLVELLYPMLIQSSNDASEVLSSFLGRAKTIRLMNEKAHALLLPDTHFACPSGYDPANVSTARDLYYLARYIFNNRPPLLEISRGSQKVSTFGPVSFNISELWNKNIFVNDETFLGGKTGYIVKSGYNGIFLFEFTDDKGQKRPVAIILLGSSGLNQRKRDVQRIYIWLKENYFPNT